MTPRKAEYMDAYAKADDSWREPVECEYHDDIPEEALEEIKDLADAPEENDPNWVVVNAGW